MERKVATDIQKAVFLHDQTIIAGLKHGCLPVAMQALGGSIHTQEIIESPNGIVNFHKYLERRGLVVAWTCETEEQVCASDIRALLKLRFPGKEPQGVFRGHLCGVSPVTDRSGEGHVVAIIPPHLMSRDTRRRLKKEQSVVVVNPAERGVVEVTLDILSNYVNNYYGPQRNFFMARINQFR